MSCTSRSIGLIVPMSYESRNTKINRSTRDAPPSSAVVLVKGIGTVIQVLNSAMLWTSVGHILFRIFFCIKYVQNNPKNIALTKRITVLRACKKCFFLCFIRPC